MNLENKKEILPESSILNKILISIFVIILIAKIVMILSLRENLHHYLDNSGLSREKIDVIEVSFIKISSIYSILFLIFLLIASYFATKSIVGPILRLKKIITEKANFNLNNVDQYFENDEVGELAREYGKMLNDLDSFNQILNLKVNERTAELKKKIEELEKFKKMTVGRELKMIELKEKIQELENNHS